MLDADSNTALDNDLDRAIELNDLRSLVLAGRPLDPRRYRKLIEAMQAGRESRARIAATERRKAKKTLEHKTVDLSTLFEKS